MTTRDILRFQFGAADAIRAVAASRAALPTGVILVLLTAVARSYDQAWAVSGSQDGGQGFPNRLPQQRRDGIADLLDHL
jgi:hypothetical protein